MARPQVVGWGDCLFKGIQVKEVKSSSLFMTFDAWMIYLLAWL